MLLCVSSHKSFRRADNPFQITYVSEPPPAAALAARASRPCRSDTQFQPETRCQRATAVSCLASPFDLGELKAVLSSATTTPRQ